MTFNVHFQILLKAKNKLLSNFIQTEMFLIARITLFLLKVAAGCVYFENNLCVSGKSDCKLLSM